MATPTPVRLSPGVYQVGDRRINATSADAARIAYQRLIANTAASTTTAAPAPAPVRDPALVERYREAANWIKGLQPGTAEYDRNAAILQQIGSQYGFNWQNDIAASGGTIPAPAAPSVPPVENAAPAPLPPGSPGVDHAGQPLPTPLGGPQEAGQPQPASPSVPTVPEDIKDSNTAVAADAKVEDYEHKMDVLGNNPNQQLIGGSQTVTIDPVTGQPTVKQSLSPEQQMLYDKGTGLSNVGLSIAMNRLRGGQYEGDYKPDTIGRVTTGDLAADRKRYEDAVYSSLTRNFDRDRARQLEEERQYAMDRGLPLGSDAYSRRMEQFNEGWNSRFDAAADRAVQGGLQEQIGQVGLNEQVIANQHRQGWDSRINNLSEIGAASSMGLGYQPPQFQGFTGSDFNLGAPSDYSLNQQQIENQRRQIQAAIAEMRRRNAAGGNFGGGGSDNPSPFSSGF